MNFVAVLWCVGEFKIVRPFTKLFSHCIIYESCGAKSAD